MKHNFFRATVLALTALTATAAQSDTGLYGKAPPEDAVFVRWIGDDAPWSQPVWGRDLRAQDLPSATYVAISASALNGAEPGTYYSVVPTKGDTPTIITEPSRDDISKVHLLLLNATDHPASLDLLDGKTQVIGLTDPMAAKSRAVNPVAVPLKVNAASRSAQFDVSLRRGQNVSFFVLENDIVMVPNTFGPVLELE